MTTTSGENGGRRVLLAGATGLVGRELLNQLLTDATIAEVIALVRRQPAHDAEHRLRIAMVDFDRLHAVADLFDVDQVFCSLGTTIGIAGSPEAFRRVDFEYPLRIAELARAAGARHFLLVSALGADSASRIFYSRVKGELEQRLRALAFRALTIARPSLLSGQREEVRPMEMVASTFAFLVPPRWRPVEARQVASALVHAARVDLPGERVMDNRELLSYGRRTH
ncbi:MAG: hypothetical protein MNPFHGCM_01928 [Gemmatimonadaceae bacterium]|nr:hypothetical protein [Gemmatimonadaceae bacterium]